jgi:hypothetical protein
MNPVGRKSRDIVARWHRLGIADAWGMSHRDEAGRNWDQGIEGQVRR